MLHRSMPHRSQVPGRSLRIVIEDHGLADLSPSDVDTMGIDVKICSGPRTDSEACPLVVDGACPMGSFDVVVSMLSEPWGEPVRRAWGQNGVVVASLHPDEDESPAERYHRCVGAGIAALHRACYPADET